MTGEIGHPLVLFEMGKKGPNCIRGINISMYVMMTHDKLKVLYNMPYTFHS